MAEPAPAPAPKATIKATQIPEWFVRFHSAAGAFRDSYGEHLNHHCAACTKAWAELRDAMDAIPRP